MVFIRHAVTEWIRRIINDTQRCAEGYELSDGIVYRDEGNDSNLLIVFYVQIMPDDFVMQLHRF
ncbi:hypothetical protein E6E06_16210 [Escherichia coli]|nr:hypothetical protein [Escherichia coli]